MNGKRTKATIGMTQQKETEGHGFKMEKSESKDDHVGGKQMVTFSLSFATTTNFVRVFTEADDGQAVLTVANRVGVVVTAAR